MFEELRAVDRAIEARISHEAAEGNDEAANRWRYVEFLVGSIVAELAMWISISKERIIDAWNEFVAAEGLAKTAARWLPNEPLAAERVAHLLDVEHVAFPKQEQFASPGMLVSGETCSVCDAVYGTCEHLAGRIYAGALARRKAGKIFLADHVAMVKDPYDKACRIMNVGGLDPLTGEPPPGTRSSQSKATVARKYATSKRKKRRRFVSAQPAQPRTEDLYDFLTHNWSRIQRHLTASFSAKQKAALASELHTLIQDVESAISTAAGCGNETEANGLRGAQVLVRSIISELAMWLDFARDNGDSAWGHFCEAESRAISCARWQLPSRFAERRLEHLRIVERVAFPFQPYFFSTGFIAATQSCTICEAPYGACTHIAGRLYNGAIGGRRITEIAKLVEMSLVDHPRNKQCRVTSVAGIDPLTGEPSRLGHNPKGTVDTLGG